MTTAATSAAAATLRRQLLYKGSRQTVFRRSYHDTMYGYREPRQFTLPDCERDAVYFWCIRAECISDSRSQLRNRAMNANLLRYVDSLRTHGHRAARIDPLDILQREEVAALNPARYGLRGPSALYDVNGILWTSPVGEDVGKTELTLEEITRRLRHVYVGRIAYEYMHSPSKTERLWFSHLLESQASPDASKAVEVEKKRRIHEMLVQSETFDKFLQAKFPNLKRYGLEGGESMLPALDALFRASAEGMFAPKNDRHCQSHTRSYAAGLTNLILSMPHRGRLNLLTSLLHYSPRALFNKIRGGFEIPEELGVSGDVISHLGVCS